MEDLTFGEQVKIILSRKKMTIKQLAELIELQTGQKMSRQNLTQRLGRDNFQEQDMRMIADILGCPFTLNIITGNEAPAELPIEIKQVRTPKAISPEVVELQIDSEPESTVEHDMTIGEVYEIHEELDQLEAEPNETIPQPEQEEAMPQSEPEQEEAEQPPAPETTPHETMQQPGEQEISSPSSEHNTTPQRISSSPATKRVRTPKDADFQPVIEHEDLEEDRERGDVNPYTGREYQTNSVRVHPKRIGYVQVYDRSDHSWTDMTEWAFLGYQERKKALLGKEYEPPIYLD
ncbi:MAG: hypothetical protein PHQ72_14150 [Hespellia sp.]|nr:hypothetical protein [Hespellia sp.]